MAFVLPFTAPPSKRQPSTVYLGRMLVSSAVDELLPNWAFFVRAVLDTELLTPTASREAFVEDMALETTRQQLGEALRDWIITQASEAPWKFQEFLAVHAMALKAMAVHDDELARAVLPWLAFETSDGTRTVSELAEAGTIRYVQSVDEFRQVAAVAASPVVNAGYSYDIELLGRLPALTGVKVAQLQVTEVLRSLAEPPADDAAAAAALAARAKQALAETGAGVLVRSFEPAGVPGLCVADPEAERRRQVDQAREQAPDSLWGDVLGDLGAIMDERRSTDAPGIELALNWNNPLVRQISAVDDQLVFDRTVKLLYVQSLLGSHRPLSAADRALLTSALGDMVALSAGIRSLDNLDLDFEGDQ